MIPVQVGCFLCIVGSTIICLNGPEEQGATTILAVRAISKFLLCSYPVCVVSQTVSRSGISRLRQYSDRRLFVAHLLRSA